MPNTVPYPAAAPLPSPPREGAFRAPPSNIEAEQQLLGAILINNRALEKVSEFLRPEHFSNALHGRIFEAIHRLIESGQVANPTLLKGYFERDDAMAEQGGSAYLVRLAAPTSSIINVESYGRMIHDLHMRRELIALGEDMVNVAFDAEIGVTATNQIETSEQRLFELATTGTFEGGLKAFSSAVKAALEMAEAAHKRDGHLSGVTTGFADLNKQLGGLHPSDLIILAARPAMGKTALVTNMAYHAAHERLTRGEEYGGKVAFFSLEMSADQLATRILAWQTHISSHKMRTGTLSDHDFSLLVDACQTLDKTPLFIDDTPGLTVSAIRTRSRRMKRQQGLDLIIIDYLQLISGGGRSENRVQELSEITRGLKILAKELQVPVIALSQLSRQVESRDDKRPLLSDLRESGSIEQDADVVMFIYREEYYKEREEPTTRTNEDESKHTERLARWEQQLADCRNKAEVIIAKQRHGPTGSVRLFFNGEYTEFGDLADEDRLPDEH